MAWKRATPRWQAALVIVFTSGTSVLAPPLSPAHAATLHGPSDVEIRGTVFADLDADHVADTTHESCEKLPTQGPLNHACADVTVFLDQNRNGKPGGSEPRTRTDDHGQFVLSGLTPDTYTVCEVVPSGFFSSAPCLAPVHSDRILDLHDAFGNFRDSPIPSTNGGYYGCFGPNEAGGAESVLNRVPGGRHWTFARVDPEWVPINRSSHFITFSAIATDFEGADFSNSDAFFWNFGDGTTGTGPVVGHGYRDEGDYDVTLRVVAETAGGTITRAIHVGPQPIVAEFLFSPSPWDSPGNSLHPFAKAGEPVTFTAAVLDRAAPYSIHWDFGDGTTADPPPGSGLTTAHTYNFTPQDVSPSSYQFYTVTMTVKDPDGLSTTATHSIGVVLPNRPPGTHRIGNTVDFAWQVGSEFPKEPPTILEGTVPTSAVRFRFDDQRVKVIDANGNGAWDRGEWIVVDANRNGTYDTGEPVLPGGISSNFPPLPSNGAPLLDDGRIRFVNGSDFVQNPKLSGFINGQLGVDPTIKYVDTNQSGAWDLGETIVFDDGRSPGIYDLGERITAGTAPLPGTPLARDDKVAFAFPEPLVDPSTGIIVGHSNVWWDKANDTNPERDRPLIFDNNGDSKYTPGQLGGDRAIGDDLSWHLGEPLVVDANANGMFDAGEAAILAAPPRVGTLLLKENANSEAPSEVAETDTPWTHATHDKTQFVVPDAGYRHLLSETVDPGGVLRPHEFIEAEWDSASDMTLRGGSDDANDLTWGAMPQYVWPSAGDRVWMEGHWVFDCGHGAGQTDAANDDYSSEMHPPRAVVTFRLNRPLGNIPFVDSPYTFPVPDLPVTGLAGVPVTEADAFISGNGSGVTDQCAAATRGMFLTDETIPKLVFSDCNDLFPFSVTNPTGHSGPVFPVNDRNYVFDVYPPGTDYTQREPNGAFVVHPPTRDGSGSDVSLQARIVDRTREIPAHACGGTDTSGCRSVRPLLCPVDVATPPPTQQETRCPAAPEHPTRLRVILPFAGSDANVFANTILVGWDDVPQGACPAIGPLAPATTPDAGRTGCAMSRTFEIRLHEFRVIRNGEGALDGDWRVFVNVGGEWRYVSGLPFEHSADCSNGDSLAQDAGVKDRVGDDDGNADGDCFRFDNHPWTVRVQDGTPIHVALGGFESDEIDQAVCRRGTCDPVFPTGVTAACGLDVGSCMNDRIGTFEFDLNPPDYTAPGLIHVGPAPVEEAPTEEYEAQFTVRELTNPPPPTSTITVGTPKNRSTTGESCSGTGQTFVTSATPITIAPAGVVGSNDSLAVQYRFRWQGGPLPIGRANVLPVHWLHSGFSLTGRPVTVSLNRPNSPDGTYVAQFSAQRATSVPGGVLVTDTEPRHTCNLILDNTSPAIAVTQPASADYVHSATLVLNYAVKDGMGAGVAKVTALLDGSGTLAGHGLASAQSIKLLTELDLGPHTFVIGAVDKLGNASSMSATFTIIVTPHSIQDDVTRFVDAGKITGGLDTDLLAILRRAASARADGSCRRANILYERFIHRVQAQSGRHIDPTAADIVTTDARYLIDHCPSAGQAPGRAPRTYKVKRGDSLYKIAETRLGDGNRWPEIFVLNRAQIRHRDRITPGRVFTLPVTPPQPAPRLYKVRCGDTLSRIAERQFGDASRWREIFRLNRDIITDPNRITPGQVLVISRPSSESLGPPADGCS
jgi:LysM repeat protein